MVKIIKMYEGLYFEENRCGRCKSSDLFLTDAIDVSNGEKNTYVCKCGSLNFK